MRDKTTLIFPFLLIAVGSGWLLTTLGVAPGVDWVWTLFLAILGFLTFVVGGFDKITAIVGPFLIAASCLSLLRQTGRLSLDVEIPILLILAGALVLIAHLPAIPVPKWIVRDPRSQQ